MRPPRPLSYQVGPYTVREDAGAPKGADGSRVVRVFARSTAIFHGTLQEALVYAGNKFDDCALTVRCPLCGSRPGARCTGPARSHSEVMNLPHMARRDAYMRFLASEFVREIEDDTEQSTFHPEDRRDSEV